MERGPEFKFDNHYVNILLNSSHLNSHTVGLDPKTEKLEPHLAQNKQKLLQESTAKQLSFEGSHTMV